MPKYRINTYTHLTLWIAFFLLLFFQLYWIAAVIFVVRYFLFGFVALAHVFSTMRKTKLSNLLLLISFRPSLLPFQKAFYYWSKSVNVVFLSASGKKDNKSALYYAEKVNLPALYSDNNKALFLSYLASLHFDAGDKELARKYLLEAIDTPHKAALDEKFRQLYDDMATN